MQSGFLQQGNTTIEIKLPEETEDVIRGVKWGQVYAFPTPAYWKYQVLARRLQGAPVRYRLGRTLKEEVAACLLGGHGIPAAIGLSAFDHLKRLGAFEGDSPSEAKLVEWLGQPIAHGDRTIRYRFVKQKSKYLAAAFEKIDGHTAPNGTGRELRNWLLDVPGIGHKTASWIARNWLDADDVAILDIHILRAGLLGGFFPEGLTVERHYLQLEARFLEFSRGLDTKASELDAVIWHEMMSAPNTVKSIMSSSASAMRTRPSRNRRSAKQSHTDTNQFVLVG